jgi:hypothetical protein
LTTIPIARRNRSELTKEQNRTHLGGEGENMDKHIDMQKLTKDAEAGNGCSILDAFKGVSLQEQISAIRSLSQDKNIRAFVDTSHWRYSANDVSLDVRESGIFERSLFAETFDPVQGKIDYSCKDVSDGKVIERSEEEKF